MKNIVKYLALAGLSISLAACNKAEFTDASIFSFATNRGNVTEDAGMIKIPVLLYGADEAVVTYSVTAGTAEEGVHYQVVDRNGNPDNSGVLTVSNIDKAKNDSIRIKIIDYTGVPTGNLTFGVSLKASADERVQIGAFNTFNCTIVDNDGGLAKLLGHWDGQGKDLQGVVVRLSFDIVDYDPSSEEDPEYPDANCVLTNISYDQGMDFQLPLYAYFDKGTSQITVYGLQVFNAYNFSGIGPHFVALGSSQRGDIIIEAGDTLKLTEDMYIWLINYNTGQLTTYYAGNFAAGFTWTKTE